MIRFAFWALAGVVAFLILMRVLARVCLPDHKIDSGTLQDVLLLLYRQGKNRAFVYFTVRQTGQRLRVYKEIRTLDDVDLVVAVPRSLTSQALLSQAAFLHLEPAFAREAWTDEQLTVIGCRNDLQNAVRLVVAAVTGGPQIAFEGRCDARMVGMHPDMAFQPGFSSPDDDEV